MPVFVFLCFFSFSSGDVAVIQLSSDTLSIEYQRRGTGEDGGGAETVGGGMETKTGAGNEGVGDSPSSVEGEQVVRCDISIKGFHLQVERGTCGQ